MTIWDYKPLVHVWTPNRIITQIVEKVSLNHNSFGLKCSVSQGTLSLNQDSVRIRSHQNTKSHQGTSGETARFLSGSLFIRAPPFFPTVSS